MAFEEDLDLFLADFGVPVQVGGNQGIGILDVPAQVIADGMVLTTDYELTVRSDQFGGLVYGDGVTVDGVNYQVREAISVEDGKFTRVMLMKVAPPATAPGGRLREFGLSDLVDVDIRNAEDGDRLVRKGDKWVDEEESDGTNVYDGGGAA